MQCMCAVEPFASFVPFGKFESPSCSNKVYRKLDTKNLPLCKNHFVTFMKNFFARGFVQIYR